MKRNGAASGIDTFRSFLECQKRLRECQERIGIRFGPERGSLQELGGFRVTIETQRGETCVIRYDMTGIGEHQLLFQQTQRFLGITVS